MGWLQILLLILQYGPALVKIIREIWELIDEIFFLESNHNLAKNFRITERQKLKLAINYYKKNRKDDSRLMHMRQKLTIKRAAMGE